MNGKIGIIHAFRIPTTIKHPSILHAQSSPTRPQPSSCLEQRVLLTLGKGVGQTALSARLPVLVPSHEDTRTTSGLGALSSETLDTALRVDLVVLEDGHLDLLPLVLDLLGGGVVLLLPLLGTSSETQDEVKGGLLLDVCGGAMARGKRAGRVGNWRRNRSSTYCSPKGSCRPPTAYQRRSIAAGHYWERGE